jgi:glycosyltransferase involved in cell wall biosynthesis
MLEILRSEPRAHLAIVGDSTGTGFHDNVQDLRAFVQAHGPLRTQVHFTGFVSDDDLISLYNSADALVLPSLWEGFGLPAVEGMQCGLPVLASNRGSLPEVVADAGLLFDPLDPASIANAVRTLLSEPDLGQALRRRALDRAATFSWERAAELAEASFRRCTERN